MTDVDRLLIELGARHVGAGRERILVIRQVGRSVRATVSSHVKHDDVCYRANHTLEADGRSAEDAAAKLFGRTP